MSRVLVISPEGVPVGDNLAGGPGIRYWEIVHQLVRFGHVCSLAVPVKDMVEGESPDVDILGWEHDNLAELCEPYDAVVIPYFDSHLSAAYTYLVDAEKPTAVDVYDPTLIENLNFRERTPESTRSYLEYVKGVEALLTRGDFFFCANERQYYYYLGLLGGLGRINPYTYHEDILALVPFGVQEELPEKRENVIKGKLVEPDDLVILWYSGIYPWFDAITLVKAMPEVLREVPNARLVIMGGVHPNLNSPDHEYRKTVEEAERQGLIGKSVFFIDWQPYGDRADYYLESDLAVCTDKGFIETALSHRTRVIDLLWGGLPVITSTGDEVSRIITEAGCGISVPVGDTAGLAETIIRVLKNKELRDEMSRKGRELVSTRFQWAQVVKPLNDYLASPKIAADRRDPKTRANLNRIIEGIAADKTAFIDQQMTKLDARGKLRLSYREEGMGGLIKRTFSYIGRKIGRGGK